MKNNKDRIICVSHAVSGKKQYKSKNKYKGSSYSRMVVRGYHTFYYQPASSTERLYLFSTKRYSPSIASAFAQNGLLVSDGQFAQTHSITMDEFYRLKSHHHNHVLNNVFERIPTWIADVIRHELMVPEVSVAVASNEVRLADTRHHDNERAA